MKVEILNAKAEIVSILTQGEWYQSYVHDKPMTFLFKRWNTNNELDDESATSQNRGFDATGRWSKEGIFVNKKDRNDVIFSVSRAEVVKIARKDLTKRGFCSTSTFLNTKGYQVDAKGDLQEVWINGVFIGLALGENRDTLVFDYWKGLLGTLITKE